MLFSQFVVSTAGTLTHDNIHTGVSQVLSVSVTLAAVANNSNSFTF